MEWLLRPEERLWAKHLDSYWFRAPHAAGIEASSPYRFSGCAARGAEATLGAPVSPLQQATERADYC
jgi:hypothetical protein